MEFFNEKEKKDITKKGGVIEKTGKAARGEKTEETLNLVKEISEGKQEGFFFVLTRNGSQSAGIVKAHRMTKLDILEKTLRALQIPAKEVNIVANLVELSDLDV